MTIIVIAPIVTALTVYFQKKLIVLNRDVRAQHSKITSSYNEGIMGAKTSKTLALEGRLTDEFEQTTAQAAKAGILHGRMRAIYVPLIVLSAEQLDAPQLGELFYFFELTAALCAATDGLSPFDRKFSSPTRAQTAALLQKSAE